MNVPYEAAPGVRCVAAAPYPDPDSVKRGLGPARGIACNEHLA